MIANCITASRGLFSLLLLVFPPFSPLFAACYLLCGITDIFDGFVARKLHTESEAGARLDSAADLLFAAVYAIRVLPLLRIPLWIWIWSALIALLKTTGIVFTSLNERRLCIRHSAANKLTGVLLFLLPVSAGILHVKYGAAAACVAASFAVIEDYTMKGAQNE